MSFTTISPTYSVEDLFSKYAILSNCEPVVAPNPATDTVSDTAEETHEVFDHPILAPIIEVLNHSRLIDAKDVAEKLQVNVRKLSNAVELHTGKTLHQFILDWRFMQSQQLLLDTDLPYSEVVDRCGYANENVLIANYKMRLNTTPHTFRTGYRIRNTNYSFNRHGYRTRLNGESSDAKNKVYYAK